MVIFGHFDQKLIFIFKRTFQQNPPVLQGTFTHTTGQCSPATCIAPAIQNGAITGVNAGDELVDGSSHALTCNEGFDLVDPSGIDVATGSFTCGTSNVCNAGFLHGYTCQQATCGAPDSVYGNLNDGSVSNTAGLKFPVRNEYFNGETVEYLCDSNTHCGSRFKTCTVVVGQGFGIRDAPFLNDGGDCVPKTCTARS